MRMRIWYLHCQEAELCCYLVIHIENLLHLLQLFYFHLWPTYWLSLICYVQFFLRCKTYEHWRHGHRVLYVPPHPCHFKPTELGWSQVKICYNGNISLNGFGMEAMKNFGINHWNRPVCLFLCTDKARAWKVM
jgi:hypothetical protein